MNASIKVTPNLESAIQALKPEVAVQAISRGISRGAQIVAGKIMQSRLTGKGPFPVAAHRLGVVTGRLRQSLRATAAKVEGNDITASIGSNVSYAKTHEFGFSGPAQIKAHQRTIKQAFGKPLASAKTVKVKAHKRKVTMPERSPIQTGIKENLPVIEKEITREIIRGMTPQK